MEGGKLKNPENNPHSKDEHQQQTQPTYDARSGNQTRTTLVGATALTTAPAMLPQEFFIYTITIKKRKIHIKLV